ncbi:hypothetical protein SDC9_65507 [bioreactor metagenome]|uniref:Uncharacterized protein n=1 Tax=bioreactor metagenome TaxID=1076179 RepID=A0A644XSN2_9ZZZZ
MPGQQSMFLASFLVDHLTNLHGSILCKNLKHGMGCCLGILVDIRGFGQSQRSKDRCQLMSGVADNHGNRLRSRARGKWVGLGSDDTPCHNLLHFVIDAESFQTNVLSLGKQGITGETHDYKTVGIHACILAAIGGAWLCLPRTIKQESTDLILTAQQCMLAQQAVECIASFSVAHERCVIKAFRTMRVIQKVRKTPQHPSLGPRELVI